MWRVTRPGLHAAPPCVAQASRAATISRMTTETPVRRVTYHGTPAMGHVLARLLEEEGVRIEQQPSARVQQDLASMLASPVSCLEVYVTTAAINAAIDRFRKLFPDAGRSVRIEGDEAEGHVAERHSSLFRTRSE